uniref:Glycosyltransferase N-terminal domain-containing protein n=1 Tax=Aegilops tauschii subsp. strangulata TaxID=200361 RepID=A0A453MIM8_AEGTS
MDSVAVVAVPFPVQGHLNQMLHLSLQLASRGLDVHYAAPAQHLRQARARARLGRGRAPVHPLPRPRHLQLRLAASRPHRRLALPVTPHAPLQRLHRRRARSALRLLPPPRSRGARPHQRLRLRGGGAAAQRRGVRAALPGPVDARRENGRRPPAAA